MSQKNDHIDIEELLERQRKEFTEIFMRHLGVLREHVDGKFQLVAEQLAGHDKKFDSLTDKVDGNTEMIGQIMEDVSEIKTDLKQKADKSDFARLEKCVVVLEKKTALSR